MEQVLHLLLQNHRKTNTYQCPEIKLSSRTHKEIEFTKSRQNSLRRNEDSRDIIKPTQKIKKETHLFNFSQQSPSNKEDRNNLYLEQIVLKKYLESYSPLEKEGVSLPEISSRAVSRIGSTKSKYTQDTKATENSYKKSISIILKSEKPKKGKIKLQKCINAIIFISRLKKLQSKNKIRDEQIVSLSENLLMIINKTINKYYCEIMRQPLLNFAEIIKQKIKSTYYNPTEDIVNNLVEITECLSESSLRKDTLKFLTFLTLEDSPLPFDFFTKLELLRLDFHEMKFKISKIDETQIKMIVGVFLGIKIFCKHVFCQPCNIELLKLSKKYEKKAKIVTQLYISYFTTAITLFYLKIDCHEESFIDELKENGVHPMQVPEENDEFYNQVAFGYKEEHKEILKNLNMWIQRITTEVMRNRKKIENTY